MKEETTNGGEDIFRDWLFGEMARYGLSIRQVAAMLGCHPVTLSKFKAGDQAMNSRLLSRFVEAIAMLKPRSSASSCLAIIRQQNEAYRFSRLKDIIEDATDEEMEEAMILITKKLFNRSGSLTIKEDNIIVEYDKMAKYK